MRCTPREAIVKSPTIDQLNDVWKKILKDPDAKKAFAQLKKDGFAISDLTPRDPTFKEPCWADYIAAIPFLPNRPSRRQIHCHRTLRKHLPLVNTLRHFARKSEDRFCQKHMISTFDFSLDEIQNFSVLVRQTADFLEKFLSLDWFTRDMNPRNSRIAELRWTIRERTGSPHDRELADLIAKTEPNQ